MGNTDKSFVFKQILGWPILRTFHPLFSMTLWDQSSFFKSLLPLRPSLSSRANDGARFWERGPDSQA
jgi:hypothetical protein